MPTTRVLIKVINQLADNADNTDRAKVLRQCFYALLRYTEFHFTREEKVMEVCGFPAIDHHKHEHRVFTEHMRELARRFDDDEVLAADIVNDGLSQGLAEPPHSDPGPGVPSLCGTAQRGEDGGQGFPGQRDLVEPLKVRAERRAGPRESGGSVWLPGRRA